MSEEHKGNWLHNIFSSTNVTKDERIDEVIKNSKVLSSKIFEYGVLIISMINSANKLVVIELMTLWFLARLVSLIYRFKNQALFSLWIKETTAAIIFAVVVTIIISKFL